MFQPFVFTTQSEATSIENSISCGFIGVVVGKSLTKVFSKKSFYQQIFFSRCASANRESHLTREHKLKCWALSIEAGSAMWKWTNVAQRWGRRETFETLMLSASSAVVCHKFNRKNKAIPKQCYCATQTLVGIGDASSFWQLNCRHVDNLDKIIQK